MGAYNSTPVTTCESTDSENARVRYGASSMQGWRRTQEDAMNCCSDLDTESMLFAVYDGHGGSEVAEYCSRKLPDFLKQMDEYKESKMEEALINCFIEFDRTLLSDSTINFLKTLAKRPESPVPANVLRLARKQGTECGDEEDDIMEEEEMASNCDEDEAAALLEEACLPVEQVLQRLTNGEITGPLAHARTEMSATADSASGSANSNAGASGSANSHAGASGSANSDAGASELANSDAGASGSANSSAGASSSSNSNGETSSSNEAGGSGIVTSKTAEVVGSDSEDEDDDEVDYSAEVDSDDSEDDDEEMRASRELAIKFAESDDYLEVPGSDSGCTACLALIRGNKLYVANAGDSRCVLSRNGKAIDLSVDHKPEDSAEKARIDKAGGFVTPDGRVNGNLNLSRAIGDHNYKRNKSLPLEDQMISAKPDIQVETLTPTDEFIIVACDGIWNSVTSQECVDFVRERLDRGDRISQICEDLFHMVLADDTVEGDGTGCDNMTCIIIDLHKSTRPDPKNHRTSSTGFDHTLSDDLPASPAQADAEPKAKKSKV